MISANHPTRAAILRAVLIAATLFIAAPSAVLPAAGAQSAPTPAELRRENEALRQRVEQLEAELNRANETIQDMRAQMDELMAQMERLRLDLRRQQQSGPASPDTEASDQDDAPRFAPLPEDAPLSSPEAMLQELQRSYQETLGELPYDTDTDYRRYLSRLNRWARIARRELRGELEWVVKPVEIIERTERQVTLSIQVLDPDTLLPYTDRAWTVELPQGAPTRRFLDYPEHDLWLMRGRVEAEPVVNTDREDPGFFDIPPFIGPFAEFDFELRIEALLRVAKPDGPSSDRSRRGERPAADDDQPEPTTDDDEPQDPDEATDK